nr:NAD-dependent epimerase/dehydratase family protein [uncultured Macellibacteroides sp.]
MNILITGINGFVGSNLVNALCKKHVVYGLDIVAPQKDGVIKTFSWEDMEENSLPAMDVVIHLAGKAHDTKNQSVAQTYFDINTGLTQKVFDYFLSSSASKLIFFSSVKAAADSVTGDVLTEEVVPAPKGPYGESKIAAEKYIQENFDLDTPQEKQVYILRPCMIHGPGNKGNLNLLYNVVRKGVPWPLGEFDNRRSFTSVENLSFVINGLVSKNILSGIYHMGDDEALSTNELIEVMCESLGKKARIWHLPKGLMTRLAALGSMFKLPLNTERLRKLTENYVVSNSKIKNALAIERMPVSAKEGLIRTIKSFKD